MFPWVSYVTVKKWSWMKSNSEARPSTVFLFYYASIFIILKPLGSGYHEIKVNELQWITRLRLSKKRWDKSSELRITERLSLRVFFFFFAVIHPTFKHAPWKESTIKRSAVDDWELFDDQRRKSARIIWFLSSPWSGFRQLSTACKSDDLSSN